MSKGILDSTGSKLMDQSLGLIQQHDDSSQGSSANCLTSSEIWRYLETQPDCSSLNAKYPFQIPFSSVLSSSRNREPCRSHHHGKATMDVASVYRVTCFSQTPEAAGAINRKPCNNTIFRLHRNRGNPKWNSLGLNASILTVLYITWAGSIEIILPNRTDLWG